MKILIVVGMVAASLAGTAAFAQGGPRGGAAAVGPGNSPGWALMTAQEREQHRARMLGFTRFEDCTAYVAEHHRQMQERAREKGVTLPPEPRTGFCERLPRRDASN